VPLNSRINYRIGQILAEALVLALLAHGQWQASAARSVEPKEQVHFSAEDLGVKRPVQIPQEVIRILQQDDMVRNVAEDQKVALDKLPAEWFSASRIELGRGGPRDLVVAAEGPLASSNVTSFWVFVHQAHGFHLALMLPAHDLVVKSTRSHGYRDIDALAATAVTVSTVRFHFDGQSYLAYRSTSEHAR
jgi:hypothetical protein